MRLYILSDAAAPHTRRWAAWFARRGHEVHVISLNDDVLPGYEPAVVHVLWRRRFGNHPVARALKIPVVLARLRWLFRRLPPDLVHAHSAGGYAWLAALSGFRPYVVTPWGTDLLVDVHRSRVNRWLTRQALRRAALITTDAEHFLPILRAFGVPSDRTLLHQFGVDLNVFQPGDDGGERASLGLGDAPVVMSTRTLNPVHDVECFVRALPLIHATNPEARFLVVGGGADLARLTALAADLGVAEVTRFTGMVDEARMRRLLRVATVYVSTSSMDAGLAGSTGEAMATELPVVVTDNSDNAGWVGQGEDAGGLLFPNGDAAVLAGHVHALLGDAQRRRRMGERNRRVVAERYNTDTEMARIEAAYLAVSGRAAGS